MTSDCLFKKALVYDMSDRDIINMIKEYLPIRQKEKKEFGEAFTPKELIDDMLDKLPEDVWYDPNLKWLDPANGIGNFPMVVYSRLMESLKNIRGLKDKKKRHDHIIGNMLYMVELNPRNVEISKRIFGEEANIYCGDFLKEDEKFEFKEFNIIIGNPPFQDKQNAVNKRGGGDLLWNKFILSSLKILVKDGYLCFIHPSGWRKPESNKSKYKNLFKIMTKENQMLYLEIHNTKDGMKMFKTGTRYDWYVLKKRKNNILTEIKGEDGKIAIINLNNLEFLPNYNFDNVFKLLAKEGEKTCHIIYNRTNYGSDQKWVNSKENDEPRCKIIFNTSSYETRKEWVSDKKNDKYKYPLIHSTPQNGIRYMYSSRNDKGHFGISKVTFGDSGIYNAIIDLEGNYGMTQHSMAIEIRNKSEGEKLKKYLESDEFNDILSACSWSNYQIDWRLFTYFKKDFGKN